jgi:hypothetical protein
MGRTTRKIYVAEAKHVAHDIDQCQPVSLSQLPLAPAVSASGSLLLVTSGLRSRGRQMAAACSLSQWQARP